MKGEDKLKEGVNIVHAAAHWMKDILQDFLEDRTSALPVS